ncbi:MAG: carboxypeptidase-like regulatory domain-containing protein [Bacteroidota bacterium]|nr:carboxypeptidase-like regulatory domain-containing protein [Bacteroidota bacterium]
MKIVPIYLFIILLLNGCVSDAPRDNPLDPQAPGFAKKGSLTGRLLVANVLSGIDEATVTSTADNISVQTDALGYFSFPWLSSGKQTFICTKENFTADTFSVSIQTGQKTEIFRNLNGAPVTVSSKIITRKIDQFWPATIYSVDIIAEVIDPNSGGDLDSVWFNVDSMMFPLSEPSGTSKYFTRTLDKGDFPTNTIDFLRGRKLYIISRDENKAINKSESFSITNIIEDAAEPVSPINNATVKADSISFHWSQPIVQFNYTYTIIISRIISGIPTLVQTYTNVNSFYQDYPIDGSMLSFQDKGVYVWAVAIVDDFGNYSRSKEYSFTVE